MKQSLLAIALATIALSSTAQAAYVYKLPLEVAGGGSLPNGTISFGNGGATTPTVPTEPEVIDPFAPENPACDPYAVGYPGNSIGKEQTFYLGWNPAEGEVYIPCKLKDIPEDKLLARFIWGFGYNGNSCDPSSAKFKVGACGVGSSIIYGHYKSKVDGEGYAYTNDYFEFDNASKSDYALEKISKIEIDGIECKNLRYYVDPKPWVGITNRTVCDYVGYEDIKNKQNVPMIVKIYGK